MKIKDVIQYVDQDVIAAYNKARKGKNWLTFNQVIKAEIENHEEFATTQFDETTILEAVCESMDGSYDKEGDIEPEGFDLVVYNGRLQFVKE